MATEDDLASFFAEDIENIVADPDKFRRKLGIGVDAFKLLSQADRLDAFLSSAAVGGASALGVFAAWSSSLGVLGTVGASIGLVATPVGWIALAGSAGLATSYGVKRLLRAAKKETVTEVPNFINTPIDVLGAAVCDLLTPISLKIAYADNNFSPEEKQFIIDHFTSQWGINSKYIENLIEDIGNDLSEFSYSKLATSLKELCSESGDLEYDVMANEIISIAENVMTSDGHIDESEAKEIAELKLAFSVTETKTKKIFSNAIKSARTAATSSRTIMKEGVSTLGSGALSVKEKVKQRLSKNKKF